MMLPPIYDWLSTTPAVMALFAQRLWPWGTSPDEPPQAMYCVWQQISGSPENYLDSPVQVDHARMQFDIYTPASGSGAAAKVEDGAQAIRDALELHGYMVDFGNTEIDPATGAYRYRLDFEFITPRA